MNVSTLKVRFIPKPSDSGKAITADSGLTISHTWNGLLWWDFGKLLAVDGPDHGSKPDAQLPSNLREAPPLLAQFYSPLPIKDCFGTAKAFALLAGILHTSTHHLPDQFPFKLCHRCQDVEHQPRSGVVLVSVDVLRDGQESDTMST